MKKSTSQPEPDDDGDVYSNLSRRQIAKLIFPPTASCEDNDKFQILPATSLDVCTDPLSCPFLPRDEACSMALDLLNSHPDSVARFPWGACYDKVGLGLCRGLLLWQQVKQEIASEDQWFKTVLERDLLHQDLLRQFKFYLQECLHDHGIPRIGNMTPLALQNLVCNRWFSESNLHGIADMINEASSHTFVQILGHQPATDMPLRQYHLLFINVKKENTQYGTQSRVCNEFSPGNHWTLLLLDRNSQMAVYGDSLLWPVPYNLKVYLKHVTTQVMEIRPMHSIQDMVNSILDVRNHTCDELCFHYPLQEDSSSCGPIVAFVASTLGLSDASEMSKFLSGEKNIIQKLIGPIADGQKLRCSLISLLLSKKLDLPPAENINQPSEMKDESRKRLLSPCTSLTLSKKPNLGVRPVEQITAASQLNHRRNLRIKLKSKDITNTHRKTVKQGKAKQVHEDGTHRNQVHSECTCSTSSDVNTGRGTTMCLRKCKLHVTQTTSKLNAADGACQEHCSCKQNSQNSHSDDIVSTTNSNDVRKTVDSKMVDFTTDMSDTEENLLPIEQISQESQVNKEVKNKLKFKLIYSNISNKKGRSKLQAQSQLHDEDGKSETRAETQAQLHKKGCNSSTPPSTVKAIKSLRLFSKKLKLPVTQVTTQSDANDNAFQEHCYMKQNSQDSFPEANDATLSVIETDDVSKPGESDMIKLFTSFSDADVKQLMTFLPPEFAYEVMSLKFDQPDSNNSINKFPFMAEIRTQGFKSFEASEQWVKEFSNLNKVEFRKSRSAKMGKYVKSQDYHCQHRTRNTFSRKIKRVQSRSKAAGCKATLKISYHTSPRKRAKYPANTYIIVIDFRHSHSLDSLHVLSFRDISKETLKIYEDLFKSGHSATTARQTYEMHLQLSCNPDILLETLADRRVNPRACDVNNHYSKWRKKNPGVRARKPDITKCQQIFCKNYDNPKYLLGENKDNLESSVGKNDDNSDFLLSQNNDNPECPLGNNSNNPQSLLAEDEGHEAKSACNVLFAYEMNPAETFMEHDIDSTQEMMITSQIDMDDMAVDSDSCLDSIISSERNQEKSTEVNDIPEPACSARQEAIVNVFRNFSMVVDDMKHRFDNGNGDPKFVTGLKKFCTVYMGIISKDPISATSKLAFKLHQFGNSEYCQKAKQNKKAKLSS